MCETDLGTAEKRLLFGDTSTSKSHIVTRQDSVECLVHDGWSAHPDLRDVLKAELSNLLPDELRVPSAWVHFLL